MSKDKRPIEVSNKDPQFIVPHFSITTGDKLSLPPDLKKMLHEAGFDYRFLNASEFRANSNHHRGGWQPFRAKADDASKGMYGVTPEGIVQRGDLILGIRPKKMSEEHRKVLANKRSIYTNFSKTQAKQLKQQIKDAGLGDQMSVSEGYDEDDAGFNSAEKDVD
jgi:hypothetical protein